MNNANIIKLSLVGFLCVLNVVGFSQDTTTAVEPVVDTVVEAAIEPIAEDLVEPPPTVRRNTQSSTEPPQISSRNRSFAIPREKNPKVATWLSVAIPGAGQVYNGQWWKVPIIYGGGATLLYFHNMNVKERNIFQTEYRQRLNDVPDSLRNQSLLPYNDAQILSMREYYRRNIELIYIFSGLLYILNIVDACVFAHLATFDVSDNLSLRIQPYSSPDFSNYALQNQRLPMQGGLRLTFTLK